MSRNFIFVFHYPCADGATAAAIAHRWINHYADRGDTVEAPTALFVRADYSHRYEDEVMERMAEKNVTDIIFLDFAPTEQFAKAVTADYRDVLILDHHASNKWLEGYDTPKDGVRTVYDTTKSGAQLAWEFFFPAEPVPQFVEYVADRDLWKWELPDSAEINAYIQSHPLEMPTFCGLMRGFDEPGEFDAARKSGAAILRHQNTQVEKACKSLFWLNLETPDIALITLPCVMSSCYESEVGHYLTDCNPGSDAAVIVNRSGHMLRFSLRSKRDFDVGSIAKMYGGGGHKNAAGFTLDLTGRLTHEQLNLVSQITLWWAARE